MEATDVIASLLLFLTGLLWFLGTLLFNLTMLGITNPISSLQLALSLLAEVFGPLCLLFASISSLRGRAGLKTRLAMAGGALELSGLVTWTVWGTLHDAPGVVSPGPVFYVALIAPTALCDLSVAWLLAGRRVWKDVNEEVS
jgi:hypothetical protein